MAFLFSSELIVRQNPTITGAGFFKAHQTLFCLKERLKAAGWTVLASSDGLTYFPASDGITLNQSGTGPGSVGNPRCWIRIRQPSGGVAPYAGVREFTFQTTDTFGSFRVKYSSLGFTGGSPSILDTPSAADEQIIMGSGTDASPNGVTFTSFGGNHGTLGVHIAAGGASEGFSWAMVVRSIPDQVYVVFFDAMKAISSPAQDVDPYVLGFNCQSMLGAYGSGGNGAKCWYKKGLAGEAFDWANMTSLEGGTSVAWFGSNNVGPIDNPISRRTVNIPAIWTHYNRPLGTNSYKGISTLFLLTGHGRVGGIQLASDRLKNPYLLFQTSAAANQPWLMVWGPNVDILPT